MEGKRTADKRRIEWSGATPSLESPRQLQLTALLNDVMNELGQVRAAQKLGIDRKTLWRCRKLGRLTPRLAAALERLLLERDLSAAMKQGKRVTELEGEVTGLQGELHATREDAEGRSDGLREEHARGMRHVERRLVVLESGRTRTPCGCPSTRLQAEVHFPKVLRCSDGLPRERMALLVAGPRGSARAWQRASPG